MQKLEDSTYIAHVPTQGSTVHQNMLKVYNHEVVEKAEKY